MARKKLTRLNEVYELPNVFQFDEKLSDSDLSEYFGNNNPITLEIGCGHGEYSNNLALHFPERNFVGLDVRATRVYVGAKQAIEENINNSAFLVSRADLLPNVFTNLKVNEIWIPFPDSLPRRRDASKRLISNKYLDIYKTIISENGVIHFKTDDKPLFDFALNCIERDDIKIIKCKENLHDGKKLTIEEEIKTLHEQVFLREGRIIKYISFKFI